MLLQGLRFRGHRFGKLTPLRKSARQLNVWLSTSETVSQAMSGSSRRPASGCTTRVASQS